MVEVACQLWLTLPSAQKRQTTVIEFNATINACERLLPVEDFDAVDISMDGKWLSSALSNQAAQGPEGATRLACPLTRRRDR